jgi:hypothetical protein
MQITDQFRVDVPIAEAWRILLDIERIAPCMPGAQLQEVEGDEYRGIVKVKVGPITAQYKGIARIVEADEAAHRMSIRAEGRDTRGQGNAAANVTATLTPEGNGTTVAIDTDLQVTGKVAQFGRGVMADVSSKLLGEFVERLHSTVLADGFDRADTGPETEPERTPEPTGVRTIDAPEAEAVDLARVAGGAVMKRTVPLLIVVVGVIAVVVWLIAK